MFSSKEHQSNNQPLIEYSKPPFYMKLIPYEELTFHVDLRPEEIIERLQHRTEKEQFIRMKGMLASSSHRTFEGRIEIDTFNISRIAT